RAHAPDLSERGLAVFSLRLGQEARNLRFLDLPPRLSLGFSSLRLAESAFALRSQLTVCRSRDRAVETRRIDGRPSNVLSSIHRAAFALAGDSCPQSPLPSPRSHPFASVIDGGSTCSTTAPIWC